MRLNVGFKLGIWLALLGTLFTGLIGYYVYDRSQKLLVESSQDKLLTATQVMAHRFTEALTHIAADIRFIETLPLVKQIIHPTDGSEFQSQQQIQLEDIFSSLLASRPEYSQIRLIDANRHGKELVRVDRDQTGIKIVSGTQLQEKNHLPYFFETVRLASGQLYISEINLNQELGAHLGFGKPTIRVATPIKNTDNQTLAIIVINVNLDEMFNHICADLPSEFNLLLTNSAGDYLIHSDPRKAFGFEKGQQFLIQNDIPASKSVLNGEQEYTVVITASNKVTGGPSLAALMRVPFGLASATRTILLVLYIPLETVLAESKALGFSIIQVTFAFGLVAIIISLILARILTQPLNLMSRTVSQFELGKPLARLPIERNDEIGDLAKSFSAMANKLNQQVAALHASETQLKTILDNLPLGIWMVGTDGQLHFLNKTFRKALGITNQHHFNDLELVKILTLIDGVDEHHFP